MRCHQAQGDITHVVENLVIGNASLTNQFDACLVEATLGKLFEQHGTRTRRYKNEQGIRLEITYFLQERCIVRVAKRHPQLGQNLAAVQQKTITESFLGVVARPVISDQRDNFANIVLRGPFRHTQSHLRQRHAGANDVG